MITYEICIKNKILGLSFRFADIVSVKSVKKKKKKTRFHEIKPTDHRGNEIPTMQ